MLTTLGSWRRPLALALVGLLTASLGSVTTTSANAANPAPTEIRIDSITSLETAAITSQVTVPGDPTGPVPNVLAVADVEGRPGTVLTVSVSFYAAGQPAYFTKDTRLVVTSNRGDVTAIDTVALKGQYTSYLTVKMRSPANQVQLTVTLPRSKIDPAPASPAQRFDVLSQLRTDLATTNFQKGIGGEGDCARATSTAPVCGIMVLPQGASSSHVLLSLGPCAAPDPGALPYEDTYSLCGDPLGSVVQVLAALNAYTRTSPATMVVKCDKTLCGGGSIQSQVLNFTRGGNAALVALDPCPAKGVVGEQQEETGCVDYVQSKRDGAGDTHLYLLFTRDARVSVG